MYKNMSQNYFNILTYDHTHKKHTKVDTHPIMHFAISLTQ